METVLQCEGQEKFMQRADAVRFKQNLRSAWKLESNRFMGACRGDLRDETLMEVTDFWSINSTPVVMNPDVNAA